MSLDLRKVSRMLAAWCRMADETDRRTVMIRIKSSADLGELTNTLERHQDYVESPGRDVVTAVVSARGLAEVALLGEVIAIDEPRELDPFVDLGARE